MYCSEKTCNVASTTITAPSTISPKSSAPILIKLALNPKIFIMIIAKSIANGMTEATIKPARKLPKKSTKTRITINAPSNKLVETVLTVFSINFVLSTNTSILTPCGNDFSMDLILFFTWSITCTAFSPFCIKTTPPTVSPFPFLVIAP